MASPQPGVGLHISEELLDAILLRPFTIRQLKIVLVIMRKTYRYGKKSDWLSNGQIASMARLTRRNVVKTIGELVALGVVSKRHQDGRQVLGIQKDYERWKFDASVKMTPPPSVKTDTSIYNKPRSKTRSTENGIPYDAILDHLNATVGGAFRLGTKSTQEAIKARWEDGFREEDFRLVHEHRAALWLKDKKMREYLRPSTLYRPSKFEGYVTEAKRWKQEGQTNQITNYRGPFVPGECVN